MRLRDPHAGFALLVAQFVVAPILLDAPHEPLHILAVALFHGILLWSLMGIADRRRATWPCLSFVAIAAAIRFVPNLSPRLAETTAHTAHALAIGTALILVTRSFFRARRVDLMTVGNAVSIYLLAGYFWSLCYSALEAAKPGSFAGNAATIGFRELHYFSYVTMTTLGYGDIAPSGGSARVLALSQAAFGQLFVAIVLGRLIGLQVAEMSASQANDEQVP